MTTAFPSNHVTTVGIGVILALVVIGAVLALLLTRLIARVIILAVVIVLGVLVWQQRNHVRDAFDTKTCHLNATFFGIHVDPPNSVLRACQGPDGA